ncbi:type IV pilus assembly protein FimV [Facilibium subflavum]|uniref:type IV pilus assembly protein FimV n=1 Tax=Facilibium subflavum TaxID=2219058 RepID=UPI000E64FFEE|nr:LysM peptidoglycan-binding domain-containing protein [Facilibium subflavum]
MRLACFAKALLLFILFGASVSVFAITTYTVKPGDSLWKIASKNPIKNISNKDMVVAIKGINAKENPSINDNIININQKLLIPTTQAEVDDGLKLYRLRHTQYLKPQPATAPTQTTKTVTKTSTPATNTSSNTVKENTSPNAPLTDISNNNESVIPASGTIVPHADRNTNKTTIQEKEKSSNDLPWFIIFLVVIVILFLWRRRIKRYKANTSAKKMKDQFYQKDLSDDKPQEKATLPLKAKAVDVKKVLQQADKLIQDRDIQHAKAILQEALNHNSKNLDIRIKLLEVYGADGDAISFNSERDYLAANLLPYDDARWKEIDALYQKYFFLH